MGSHLSARPNHLLANASERVACLRIHHHRFIQILLVALLLRIVCMPFFGHIDFLSEWRRIFHAWDTGYLFPGSRFVTSLIEFVHFSLIAPLLAEKNSMFQTANWAETTASHLEYFGFLGHHAILRTVFLLKLPYLLCDVITGVLIYRFFDERKPALIAAGVWFFNPVTFFASYIFGRYEAIPLMFVAASFLMLKRERMLSAALLLGLAMWSREIVITLFPFFLVFFAKHLRGSPLRLLAAGGILLLFVGFASNLLPNLLGFPKTAEGAGGTVNIVGASQSLQLFGFQIGYYYAFVLAYVLLFLHFLFSRNRSVEFLITVLAVYYCAFFATAIHTVHYVSWGFVPFTFLAARNLDFARALGLFCLTWIAFWLVASDLGVFTHWLAMPSSLFWNNLPIIPAIAELQLLKGSAMTMHNLIFAGRSVYAATLIFMIVLALRHRSIPATSNKA